MPTLESYASGLASDKPGLSEAEGRLIEIGQIARGATMLILAEAARSGFIHRVDGTWDLSPGAKELARFLSGRVALPAGVGAWASSPAGREPDAVSERRAPVDRAGRGRRGGVMTIIEACHDHNLLRPLFRNLESWATWFVVLKAIFGLPLTELELRVFTELTGRTVAPTAPAQECWLIMGRRAGKSFIVSLIAVYLAAFKDYVAYFAPGERATVMVIACDRKQARIILRYITAILEQVPMLAAMVERRDAESIDLSNRVTIEVGTCSFRSIRGYTVAAAICEEISFWYSEDSANPAEEILSAIRPAMATIPHAMLLAIGTPHAKRGPMYETFKRHYGEAHAIA